MLRILGSRFNGLSIPQRKLQYYFWTKPHHRCFFFVCQSLGTFHSVPWLAGHLITGIPVHRHTNCSNPSSIFHISAQSPEIQPMIVPPPIHHQSFSLYSDREAPALTSALHSIPAPIATPMLVWLRYQSHKLPLSSYRDLSQ